MKLKEKTLVVTGGGNGIGRELVLQLLQRGARVAALDMRQESLEELKQAANAGERLSTHVANITDRERVFALVEEVIAHHGAVDGVINNAGIIQPFVDIRDLDEATIRRVMDVNLYGTIHMTQAFLPRLLERPVAHILNVSSMGGFLPVPGQAIYGAAKAAVKLMTEGLYAELMDTKVHVSVAMPGAIATNIIKNSGAKEPTQDTSAQQAKITSPQKAARIMLDGIEKNRLHIHVGPDSRLLHWAVRIAPKAAIRFIQKQMKKMLKR